MKRKAKMKRKDKLTWSDIKDGANAAEKYGMKKHEIMRDIKNHTQGMDTIKQSHFVKNYFDRTKKEKLIRGSFTFLNLDEPIRTDRSYADWVKETKERQRLQELENENA